LIKRLLEFSKSTETYLNKQSILDYLRFVIKSGEKDVNVVLEALNYNFTQFFEHSRSSRVIRPFKKDYME